MAIQIQLRRGDAADWTTINPTLAEGEVGVEIDTLKLKVGNGTDNWTTLPYFGSAGTVTSVGLSVPTGLQVANSPVTTTGTLAVTFQSGYSIPTTSSQSNWDTAYTDRLKWDGGATGLTASTGRTSLGASTLGSNLFTISDPSAVSFPRFNADNSVSALSASDFRTAIGAGTGNGTVTSVGLSVPTGFAVSNTPVTSSGTIALAFDTGYSLPTTASQTNWDTAYTDRLKWDGGSSGLNAATGRTSLGLGTAATMTGPTGTIVGTTDTQTLTNKRVNPRVTTPGATSGSFTPDGDTSDVFDCFGLTGAITFNAPSGTPVNGQRLIIRVEDNGSARGITWTTTSGAYRAVGITLPTTTVASKITYVGCIYNSTDVFWDVIAVVTQA